ncbi:phosphopantetheine-binding protein [Mesomycoplasma molare]|uniref:Phosphopantetheine-binding protein n=1 Tax=Mesomycoplasma molare TaxID=171288 RepID=A0ABY5TTY1_9BACT|nr:phosphopantetheine-binding protein [Mesomycoplasma molare]UWD34123.1 phosphopantetheine-binding protein [Mesomycoplasma molare]
MKDFIFNKLKKITNKKFDENSNIYSIGVDSLDLVEMITDVEEELNISILDEELTKLETIKDVITLLENKKNAS